MGRRGRGVWEIYGRVLTIIMVVLFCDFFHPTAVLLGGNWRRVFFVLLIFLATAFGRFVSAF